MGIIENVIVQVNCLPIGEYCITMKHVQQQCDANKCRCILFQKTTWIFRRFCWLFYLCWIYIVRIVYILLVLLLLTGSLSGHLKLSKDKMQRTILKFKSWTVQKKTLKTGSNIKGLPETPSDTILNKMKSYESLSISRRVQIEVILKRNHSGDLASSPWARLLM